MSLGVIAIAVGVVLLILIVVAFAVLWKVPAADQALIITGVGARKASPDGKGFKIVTGGGAMVIPVMQKAQYLSMKADKALLEVDGVDSQKIPVGVRGVAIFKVGDDEHSITNAARSSVRHWQSKRAMNTWRSGISTVSPARASA